MLLTKEKSDCAIDQSIVVSKDKGTSRKHRAINPERQYCLRHYKLDGDIFKQETCCDFLLINDSLRKAYFIELKGGSIDDAIPQLEAGVQKCRNELKDYIFYYRIVASKVRTHNINKNRFRKFQDKCAGKLEYKSEVLEEILN